MSMFGEPDLQQQIMINQSLGLPVSIPNVDMNRTFSPQPVGVGLGGGAGINIGQNGPPALPPAAGPLAVIPAALAALPAVVPALAGVAGVAAGLFGIAQGLGFGEGGGIGGNNLLGGDNSYINGIPLGGPGLAEPPASMVIKEWHVSYDWGRLQYYLVQMPTGGRRIALYNTRTKKWKSWPWRKPLLAVIGKNMPSHKQLTRLKRCMVRHRADAKTIMKLTGGMPGGKHALVGHRKRYRHT
jgi:hypothetical protein